MISVEDAVNHLIERNRLIKEMIEREPEVLLILKTAALFTDGGSRWHMYEELKRRGRSLVGYGATMPELRTSRHYEAMLDAIDALLPEEEGVRDDEEAFLSLV